MEKLEFTESFLTRRLLDLGKFLFGKFNKTLLTRIGIFSGLRELCYAYRGWVLTINVNGEFLKLSFEPSHLRLAQG
jgi:hypothetical protein